MNIDLVQLNGVLCKSIRILVAARRLAKEVKLDCWELETLEREIRVEAGCVEGCIRILKSAGKPLVLKS